MLPWHSYCCLVDGNICGHLLYWPLYHWFWMWHCLYGVAHVQCRSCNPQHQRTHRLIVSVHGGAWWCCSHCHSWPLGEMGSGVPDPRLFRTVCWHLCLGVSRVSQVSGGARETGASQNRLTSHS